MIKANGVTGRVKRRSLVRDWFWHYSFLRNWIRRNFSRLSFFSRPPTLCAFECFFELWRTVLLPVLTSTASRRLQIFGEFHLPLGASLGSYNRKFVTSSHVWGGGWQGWWQALGLQPGRAVGHHGYHHSQCLTCFCGDCIFERTCVHVVCSPRGSLFRCVSHLQTCRVLEVL